MKSTKPKPLFNKSRLRSAIRKEWLYSDLRRQALARSRQERGVYKCEHCSSLVDTHNIEVNHRITVTPPDGLNNGNDWGIFISNLLFCGLEGLECLCTECHNKVTAQEREEKAKNKLAKKKTK